MTTGFSFGAKTTAPQFGTTNTSSFGSTPNNQFSFGSNTQQQQSSAFQLGSTLNKPTGSVLPLPQSAGFSIGAPTITPSSTFGIASTSGGLTSNAAPISTINFLPSTSSTATTGLSFGSSTTTPALNFSSSISSNASGLTFGTPTTSTVLPTSTSGFTLGGLTSSAAPTPTVKFGTISGIATSAPSTSLNFGVASTAPTSTFGVSTSTPVSLNFGTPAASASFSLTTPTTSVVAAPEKVGLGGIQTSTANSLGNIAAKEVPPKEQQVPNEIQQDIENFKNYIKQQKSYSSDVSRCCVKDFRSVEAQIGVLNNVLKEIESQLQRNRCLAEKLKYDTAQGLQLLEMAQRTQDTPSGLQYENVAPMNFFLTLADNFEKEMHALKIQIENTDKYVKNFGQPATLTSQDLTLGMKRLHDTFVALAGRLQSVHTQVESQKELYTNIRKQVANDYTNPFEMLDRKLNPSQIAQTPATHSPPKIACGPTPFNQIINSNFSITAQQSVGTTGHSTTPGFGFGSSTNNLFGNTGALNINNPGFQNTTLGTLGFQNTTLGSGFQLQKPPTGNKRGKQ